MATKFTPWFRGDVKPARPGVYQRRWGTDSLYAKWDGRNWFMSCQTPEIAACKYCASHDQCRPWRGLAADPSTKGA